MIFFKNKKQAIPQEWMITSRCLNLIFESSKSTHPNEFGGLLRVDEEKKRLIDEVVLIPGTISGDSHAIFKLYMMPIDFNIVGTVHSHPSYNYYPSSADKELFRKHGRVHIIVSKPYDMSSWKAYDSNADPIELEVI